MRYSTGIVLASTFAGLQALLWGHGSALAQRGVSASVASVIPPPVDAPRPATGLTASSADVLPEVPLETPTPPPHRQGLVLESRLGALAFLGDFRHVAPTAPWWHVDLGYEIFKWLAAFGYGELSFTDTSQAQGPAAVVAFPVYGFGAGARATIHVAAPVALFVELDGGAMRADVPHGALADIGFGNAERFGFAFGGGLGVDWYPTDRHLAFGLDVGLRDAPGFAEQILGTAPPLMLDASAAVRYTF